MRENGFVPSQLVLCILPRFPRLSMDIPNQAERMEALRAAQAEMNFIRDERRVLQVLTRNIPPAADRIY